MSATNMNNYEQELKFVLNAALCQSPEEVSKTQKAMDYIRHFSIVSRANNVYENGVHHITVILTNNSISETNQWKIRLKNKFAGEGMNIVSLSSNKNSDINHLSQLWYKLLLCKNASSLPDLIVMCTHDKRTSDLIKLIDLLKNKMYNFSRIGIHHITLTIMFDEADKNITLIKNCLSGMNKQLTMSRNGTKTDDVVRDVHFITATPLQNFWKELKKCNIDKLSNINTAIKAMDENSCLNIPYKELMKKYRYLEDHNRIHAYDDKEHDTVEYAKQIINSVLSLRSEAKTIFVPAEIKKSSHYKMKEMLQEDGLDYVVYIDNSDKTGKGFHYPDGKFESLEDFNMNNKVKGELRDTFVAWRKAHPKLNLAITGYLNVIRGITFNTTGFNFTDVIISSYHAQDLASLLQLFGRANGDKKYVDVMNIYCPRPVWDKVKKQIHIMDEIMNADQEYFEEKHFREKTKRERNEIAWTVPTVFTFEKERFDKCTIKKGNTYNRDLLFSELEKDNKCLIDHIRTLNCHQITKPTTDKSYNTFIKAALAAAQENKTLSVGVKKEHQNLDGYQLYLDNIGHKIIVNIHYGSRIINEDSD
jgi:hypothetical protein